MKPNLLRSSLTVALSLSAALTWAQGSSSAPQRATVAPSAQAAGTSATAAGTSRPSDYKLGPGDSIKVQVYQNPDLSVETRVSESGVVNYPLVGAVEIGGLSLADAEARIAQALQKGNILKAPQVNINLIQVRGSQVAVLGQVQKPGRFALETTNVRVSEMLAAAGGVAPTGDDVVVVTGTRNGQPFRQSVDVNQLFAGRSNDDIVLQAGDSLFVGKAPTFYIYGEAQRPGTYRVERGMTVQQAIAQGGGITPRGSESRLRLNRTNPDGTVVQMAPRLSDPVQPGDVLFVRESLF